MTGTKPGLPVKKMFVVIVSCSLCSGLFALLLHRGLGGRGFFASVRTGCKERSRSVQLPAVSTHARTTRTSKFDGDQQVHSISTTASPLPLAARARMRGKAGARPSQAPGYRLVAADAARATATGLNGRWEGGNARRGPFAQTQTGRRQIDLTAVERTSAAELRRTGWRSICTAPHSNCSTMSPSRLCAGRASGSWRRG